MTPAMFHELMAVVALANETNRLANGYRDRRRRAVPSTRAPERPTRDARQSRQPRRGPVSRDRSVRRRVGSPSTRRTRCTGRPAAAPTACRSCSCTAVPAAAACRIIAAISIPSFWRIVLVDQRGAGRSTPVAELDGQHDAGISSPTSSGCACICGIERWLRLRRLVGVDARARVRARRTRSAASVSCCAASFSRAPREIDWFMHGMRNVFPEAWRAFAGFLPAAERADLLGSYYRRLTDPDPAVHLPAAHAWDRYEGACSTLLPARRPGAEVRQRCRGARDRAHRGALLRPRRVPRRRRSCSRTSPRIRHLPCTIVQGRYDIVCPPVTADALARAWPEAEYVVVPDAGHSVREPGITRELVAAVERMKTARRALKRVPGLLRVALRRRRRCARRRSSKSSSTSSPTSG